MKEVTKQGDEKGKRILTKNYPYSENENNMDRLSMAFLSHVSHELRTPMNAIMGFTNILQQSEITEEEREEYLKLINQSGTNLIRFVDNLIELAMIESGNVLLRKESVNIVEFLNKIYNQLNTEKHQTEKSNIVILKNIDKEDITTLKTDGYYLEKAILNLALFMLHKNNEGIIEIGFSSRKNNIDFYVKDTDQNFQEEKICLLKRCTETRMISKSQEYKDSYGISLILAQKIIDAMEGNLWFCPNNVDGTTIHFSLPLAETRKNKKTKAMNHNMFGFPGMNAAMF
ncbi:MAG TPA: HAMP domain-containing sensor histidine kinase [Bacteroidales bacterium]|nr:HAMP domain-containing sensor histidine kinase [Bacteroidales bacterium]